MPTYVYQVITEDGDDDGQVFEYEQKMSDPPLTRHPTTGQPVRRVIQPPNLSTKYGSTKNVLSNDRLAKHGFTKYERAGDGKFIKTAGKGPKQISSD